MASAGWAGDMASGGGSSLIALAALGLGGYVLYRQMQTGGAALQPAVGVTPTAATPAAVTPAPAVVTPTPAATVLPIAAAPTVSAGITMSPVPIQPPLNIAPPTLAQVVAANLATNPATALNTLYQTVLGRSADPAGLDYWMTEAVHEQQQGLTADQIAANLTADFQQAKAAGAS